MLDKQKLLAMLKKELAGFKRNLAELQDAGYSRKQKHLLEDRWGGHAKLETYVVNEGKCIDCGARVAITDLDIRLSNGERIELSRYRDLCDCD